MKHLDLTPSAEFAVRRISHLRMIAIGRRAQACGAARLAARLYRAGASGSRAIRLATTAPVSP